MTSETHLIDCMELMAKYPDNYFDLAVVDPPYGIGIDGQKLSNKNKKRKHNRKAHNFKGWDNAIPNEKWFIELFRVSKNQIIWGGNYFTKFLFPTKAWIFWYKGQNDLTMSDGEMAWTSFKMVTKQVEINRGQLMLEGGTIHPTQKPIALYDWIFSKYAKQGDKILDTHLGSQSSRIAAYKAGLDFVGSELNPDYFRDGNQRFEDFKMQFEQEVGVEKVLKGQARLF